VSLYILLPHLARFRLLACYWSEGVLHLDLTARRHSATCPQCQHRSTSVHSAYRRMVTDLPISGTPVRLHVRVRRFFCRATTCPRRIFAERFPTLVPSRGRYSAGVYATLRHIGLAVGGRAGAPLAQAIGVPGSSRTILRLVHQTPLAPQAAPRVIGLDEWAWRRGKRFGTIVCDLERHQVIDLLPDRSAQSVAQWLHAHPSVEIVCRDRSGLYAEGVRHGAPQAVQVVDRFHMMQNLRDALERFFLRYRHVLKTLGASIPPPSVASPPAQRSSATASQQRHERWVRLYYQIHRLHAQHLGIAAIARRVQVSRPTVYRYLALPQPPERQRPCHRRSSLLTPFIPYILRRWNAGCRNAQQLWQELVAQGYQQSRRTVQRYVGQLRQETGTRFKFRQVAPAPWYDEEHHQARPTTVTAHYAARLFLSKGEERQPAEQDLLARLLTLEPIMAPTYELVQTFCRMLRHRHGHDFDAWVATVQHTGVKELRAFVTGLLKDAAAVRAGLSLVWSNGPTEGFVHRLKLLKRQAYGRAGVAFLRQRILATPSKAA
jgi:transposase